MNSTFALPVVVGLGFAVSFLLSGMEAGVPALKRLRIRRLAREGNSRAQRLQGFLDHPEKFLWTILVGNSLATCAVLAVVSVQVKDWLAIRPAAFMALMVGVLLLLWIFGDLLPKLLFRRFPNRLCLHGVGPFRLLHFLLSPAVAAMAWISDGLLRLTGGRATTGRLFGSRAELRQAIEESAQSLSREEVVMIHRILDLQSRRVRDVMTPINEAATLPSSGTVADLLALVRERPVSYVPVWRGTGRDRRVLGVVALNTILLDETIDPARVLETLVQPALFIDEDSRLEATLHSLQRGRARLAIVLNPGRRETGVITLNDILRTMFGEVGGLMNWHDLQAIAGKAFAGIVIVALNAFFVAAEFALVRVRDTQLQPLAQKGSRRAALARIITQNIDAYLSTSQLGITLCGLGMGALVEPLFGELLKPLFDAAKVTSTEARHTIAFIVGFLVNAFVLIALGEIAPKSLALRRAVPIALTVAHPLWLIYWALFPFIWLLNGTAQWALTKIGIGVPTEAELAHSDDELRLMILSSQRQTAGTALGRDIILNALDLRRRRAREVMQPRPEIVVIDTAAPIAECIKLAEETRYSRFPLCEGGSLDHTIGVVHVKDLHAQRDRVGVAADLRTLARPLIYIPETARLERVLQFLLERRLHLAIVVDEYGGTTGLLTLENILEELVGQIQDEFDQERPLQIQIDDHTWDLAGNLPLHDLGHLVGEPLHHPGVASVSGWITHRLGGFPKEGDTLPLGAFLLRVEETRGARVTRLRLTHNAPKTPDLKSQI